MRKMTEDFIGTCQWCFGEYKTNAQKKIVLHGYQRPGWGSTVGQCRGVGHAPFEYEHALTEVRIEETKAAIERIIKQIKLIDDGMVTRLRNPNYVAPDDPRRSRKGFYFSSTNAVEYYQQGERQFDRYLGMMRNELESERRFTTGIAKHLEEAVRTWTHRDIVGIDTPPTGRERYVRDAYDPDAEAQRKANAEAKAIRDAKPGKITVNVMARLPFPDRNAGLTHDEWSNAVEKFYAAEKAFKDKVKKWAKARFPGKTWVGDGDSLEAERLTRLSNISANSHSVVVAFRPEWQYRDEIMGMFPDAHRYDKDTNRRDPVTKQGIGKGKDIRLWVTASDIFD